MTPTLACTSLAFDDRPLEAALEAVAALGFVTVDLGAQEGWAHVQPSVLAARPSSEMARIERALAAAGLVVVALNASVGPDPTAEEQRIRISALIELAERLGSGSVTLRGPAAGLTVEEATARLAPVLEIASQTEVKLTLEVHKGRITELPRDAAALAEATGLGLTLDPSHIVAGPAAGAGLDELTPYTEHVHVRDARADTLEVSIGEGVVPFAEIFSSLAARGYDGTLSIEYIEGTTGRTLEDDLVCAGVFVRDHWPGPMIGASNLADVPA